MRPVEVIASTLGWLGPDAAQVVIDRLEAHGYIIVSKEHSA